MTTFAVERFADILPDLPPMWRAHYAEAAADKQALPLDMDLERYAAFDAADMLLVVTARRDGRLVGYVFAIVCTHMHCRSALQAFGDLHYLAPEARGGRTALRLFQALEAAARKRGAIRLLFGTPTARDQGRLLSSLGWKPIETTYSKVIAA